MIGLDSNRPADGPRYFPVGARVCSSTGTASAPVVVSLIWDEPDETYIYLRPDTDGQITFADGLTPGECRDAYFEVKVNPISDSFDRTRDYYITAASGGDLVSTTRPRELYVEHLISPNRNATTDMLYGTTLGNLTSVAPGGGMSLLVGEIYYIQLVGGTATQGYEQFEQFITLTNTMFRINSVSTDYAVNTSPYVADPSNKLYADACLWENDPASPNYRAHQRPRHHARRRSHNGHPGAAPATPEPTVTAEPAIAIFDPVLSKVGELHPGQLGLPGESLTWIVTITNVGTAPGTDIVITDVLQAGLQVTAAAIDQGTATVSGPTVTFYIPVLNPGQSVTGAITTLVLRSPHDGQFVNIATLSGPRSNGQTATAPVAGRRATPGSGARDRHSRRAGRRIAPRPQASPQNSLTPPIRAHAPAVAESISCGGGASIPPPPVAHLDDLTGQRYSPYIN